MRLLVIPAMILMGACSQEPAVELDQDVAMMDVTYICSRDGEIRMVTMTDEGLYQVLTTDGTCDPVAWEADVRERGPVRMRDVMPSYRDFLRNRGVPVPSDDPAEEPATEIQTDHRG